MPLFKLNGLDPQKKYSINELNVDKPLFWGSGRTFDGDWLINHGINPQLVKVYDSGIWILEAQE